MARHPAPPETSLGKPLTEPRPRSTPGSSAATPWPSINVRFSANSPSLPRRALAEPSISMQRSLRLRVLARGRRGGFPHSPTASAVLCAPRCVLAPGSVAASDRLARSSLCAAPAPLHLAAHVRCILQADSAFLLASAWPFHALLCYAAARARRLSIHSQASFGSQP